jgi:hypothetical protein
MTDRYKFWRDSLAGRKPPIINEDPQPGFYRMKRGNGWAPVAVWPLPGTALIDTGLGFKIGQEIVDTFIGTEKWPWYSSNPITEAEYRRVAEQGGKWSDEDPTVAAMIAQVTPKQIAEKINNKQQLDPHENARLEQAFIDADKAREIDPTDEYREQIKVALAGVPIYAKIESDEANARGTGLRNMLMDLASAADKAREAEKAPYFKKVKEIDSKWMPLIKEAREGAAQIKRARNTWEDDKRKAAAEAARRAEEVLAEQLRQSAEDVESDQMAPIDAPLPKSNLPPPSSQITPTYGRRAHVGTKMVVTELDAIKFITALKPRSEWPAVFEMLLELAQKLANKGIILDGVTAEERADTR